MGRPANPHDATASPGQRSNTHTHEENARKRISWDRDEGRWRGDRRQGFFNGPLPPEQYFPSGGTRGVLCAGDAQQHSDAEAVTGRQASAGTVALPFTASPSIRDTGAMEAQVAGFANEARLCDLGPV
ncbi:hypothetical protein MRX96_039242 [Rhipicephalus microplus]